MTWTEGKPCQYRVGKYCRLAAAAARVPKEFAQTNDDLCAVCIRLRKPRTDSPNGMVAALAHLAKVAFNREMNSRQNAEN